MPLRNIRNFALLLAFLANIASANEDDSTPVWIIDEVISEPGATKFEIGFRHFNLTSSRTAGSAGGYLEVLPSVYVPFISNLEQATAQTDKLIAVLGIRRGLTQRAEVGLRTSGSWSSRRVTSNANESTTQFELEGLSAGVTYRLSQTSLSSVIAFGNVGLINRISSPGRRASNQYLENLTLGATGYIVQDPLIFSLTATHSLRRSFGDKSRRYRGGSVTGVSPVVSFMANNSITLSAGLNMSYMASDRYRSRRLQSSRTSLRNLYSIAYRLSRDHSVYFDYSSNISASARDSSVGLSLILTR